MLHPQDPAEEMQQPTLPLPEEKKDEASPLDIDTIDVMGLAKAHDIDRQLNLRKYGRP